MCGRFSLLKKKQASMNRLQTCGCSVTGSVKSQCNPKTGICTCRLGYEGEKCNRCSHGYYGYPKCRRCSCNPAGTVKSACDSLGICQCHPDGQCPCKVRETKLNYECFIKKSCSFRRM